MTKVLNPNPMASLLDIVQPKPLYYIEHKCPEKSPDKDTHNTTNNTHNTTKDTQNATLDATLNDTHNVFLIDTKLIVGQKSIVQIEPIGDEQYFILDSEGQCHRVALIKDETMENEILNITYKFYPSWINSRPEYKIKQLSTIDFLTEEGEVFKLTQDGFEKIPNIRNAKKIVHGVGLFVLTEGPIEGETNYIAEGEANYIAEGEANYIANEEQNHNTNQNTNHIANDTLFLYNVKRDSKDPNNPYTYKRLFENLPNNNLSAKNIVDIDSDGDCGCFIYFNDDTTIHYDVEPIDTTAAIYQYFPCNGRKAIKCDYYSNQYYWEDITVLNDNQLQCYMPDNDKSSNLYVLSDFSYDIYDENKKETKKETLVNFSIKSTMNYDVRDVLLNEEGSVFMEVGGFQRHMMRVRSRVFENKGFERVLMDEEGVFVW